MNQSTLNRTAAKIREWRDNPCLFVYENFGVTPDPWQEQTLKAFADASISRISMQACAGPGKSAVLAWCGLNFLTCYGEPGEHPKGAAVSITGDNLKDNLWPELAKWRGRSSYCSHVLTWTKERIFATDHPETWFISARSWSKNSDEQEQGRTLSGLHSKYVLALIDESGDVPIAVAKAAEQALSTGPKFGKIVMAGNPTSQTGILYAAATKFRDLWFIVRITGDPDDPNRSSRIDIDWARQQIQTYGRDNPWVMAFILGLFPPGSINTLLGPEEVEKAMNRAYAEDQIAHQQRRLGIDVARFGDDRTVIFPRQGLVAFKPVIMRGARTGDIAARVALAKANWGSEMELVDGTGGYGAGVIDSLLQAGHAPFEVSASGKAVDPRYLNKRAEMWFQMAEWLRRGGALPNMPELAKELTAPTYFFQNGKFQLEPKEQIKKRLGFSPDLADALALTFGQPEMPAAGPYGSLIKKPRIEADWNPYDETRL
jgi:phage terminase large subunit